MHSEAKSSPSCYPRPTKLLPNFLSANPQALKSPMQGPQSCTVLSRAKPFLPHATFKRHRIPEPSKPEHKLVARITADRTQQDVGSCWHDIAAVKRPAQRRLNVAETVVTFTSSHSTPCWPSKQQIDIPRLPDYGWPIEPQMKCS